MKAPTSSGPLTTYAQTATTGVYLHGNSQRPNTIRTFFKLSTTDCEIIRDLTEAFTRRFQTGDALTKLIHDWTIFAEEVKAGYAFSIFDYTNELGGRNILESVLRMVSTEGKLVINGLVSCADTTFLNATIPLNQPIRQIPGREMHWWYYRLPKEPELRGEFRQDLVSEGLIPH